MIEPGTAITLEDGLDYICAASIQLDGKNYLYLISVTDPAKICFAAQIITDGTSQIYIIGNHEEKLKILAALQAKIRETTQVSAN